MAFGSLCSFLQFRYHFFYLSPVLFTCVALSPLVEYVFTSCATSQENVAQPLACITLYKEGFIVETQTC